MNYFEIKKKIDAKYGCLIAETISSIGNKGCDEGFRNAGSSGEKKTADYIISQMNNIGLHGIETNSFPVDTWEYVSSNLLIDFESGAQVEIPLSAFAGSPGFKNKKIKSQLIDVGHGTLEECNKAADLDGNIAIIRINLSGEYWVGVPAHQAEIMGAVAIITVYEGDSFGKDPDARNTADCIARPSIPIFNISKNDARLLFDYLNKGNLFVTLQADMSLTTGSSQNIRLMIRMCGKENCLTH